MQDIWPPSAAGIWREETHGTCNEGISLRQGYLSYRSPQLPRPLCTGHELSLCVQELNLLPPVTASALNLDSVV